MVSKRRLGALALAVCVAGAAGAGAQEPTPPKPAQPTPAPTKPAPPPPQPTPPRPITTTTLMVEITVNRIVNGKTISSVPYTLAVSPDGPRSTLRIGGEVPVPTATFTPLKEPDARPTMSYSYRRVGTSIDVTANTASDGRYRLSVTLEESSVYPPAEAEKDGLATAQAGKGSGTPAFRSLAVSNTFTVRDGQVFQFTAGSDLISGETAQIAVKATVTK